MMSSPVFYAASDACLGEELVSSCSAAVDPYRRSMLRLLEYVGLEHYGTAHATVPSRTSAESAAIAKHVDMVRDDMARHQESVRRRNIRISKRKATSAMVDIIASANTAATQSRTSSHHGSETEEFGASGVATAPPTIYLSFEDSAEWKAFLASVAPLDRLAVTVRRRLTVELWRAHRRQLCLWCWFPQNMCMCAQLDAYKVRMPASVLDARVEVTMLLHSEELMRSTNSGHVAAYLLGAPIRVWGMDADDFYLRELGPACTRTANGVEGDSSKPEVDSNGGSGGTVTVLNVSLYPSAEAVRIEDFIHEKALDVPVHVRAYSRAADASQQGLTSCEGGQSSTDIAAHPTSSPNNAQTKVHLILLDSTWGQALSLNRKLSRLIPRVKLNIAEDYDSLFQALRKRTRDTGVSTLEATTMAVEQCVRAMGYGPEAAECTDTLIAAMKAFVDARCLLKYAEAPFTKDGAALDAFRDRRDDARRTDAAARQEVLASKMESDEEARRLRLPPVLNYCYACDCVIGWHRMPEHVMGRSHRTVLTQKKNGAFAPSAASRSVLVPDFSRPTRAERAAMATAAAGNVDVGTKGYGEGRESGRS